MFETPSMRVPPTPESEDRFSTPRAGKPSRPSMQRRNELPAESVKPPQNSPAATRPTTAPPSVKSPVRPGLRRTREQVYRPHDATAKQTVEKFARGGKLGKPQPGEGVIALADTYRHHDVDGQAHVATKSQACDERKIVNGVLQRLPPKHAQSNTVQQGQQTDNATTPKLEPKSRLSTCKSTVRSHPGDIIDENNKGIQTDSPARRVGGRGATFALSPIATYKGGVEVLTTQPKGPFVHGEDVRFIGPKKRGGTVNCNGIKALMPSGRLMGSEVRAWWPDEGPEDDGYIPGPGETTLWQSSPYAVGRNMNVHDRRTFGPNMSNKEWATVNNDLNLASTKLGEMERSLRSMMAARQKMLSRQGALVSNNISPRDAHSIMSKRTTRTSETVRASERSFRETQTVVSGGLHVAGYGTNGSLKVRDWLSPRRPLSEASMMHTPGKSKTKTIPDYEKLEKGARLGDSALKALRGQEVLDESIRVRDNPPAFDHTNRPTNRPHQVSHFRYYGRGGEIFREKRLPLSKDEIKCLEMTHVPSSRTGAKTHRPVSAAVQTVQGRGTYQGTAFKDMVAEAVNQINHDLNKNNRNVTPRRRDKVFTDKLWNRFKGEEDQPFMFVPRSKLGVDEKILSRVVADQIQPEIWITSEAGHRHPAVTNVPIDGVGRIGEKAVTPEINRKTRQIIFPDGPRAAARTPSSKCQTKVLGRALAETAGIELGNNLLRDERMISIKYA